MESFAHVTLIFSMPRSRSQWFRWFLSSGCEAWHDPLNGCYKPQDLINKVVKWSKDRPGERLALVCTGSVFFHDTLCAGMPGLNTYYLFRHLSDINNSWLRQGFDVSNLVLKQQAHMFQAAYGLNPAAKRLHYGALPARKLQEVFVAITGRAIDIETVEEMSAVKVDVPVKLQPKSPRAAQAIMKHCEALRP